MTFQITKKSYYTHARTDAYIIKSKYFSYLKNFDCIIYICICGCVSIGGYGGMSVCVCVC